VSHRPLRVLTLTDELVSGGGAEQVANRLAASLDPARFESYICATRPRHFEHVVRELREAGVRITILDRRGRLDMHAWPRLIALLRRERIDVIHAHKFGSNIWASSLGRLAGVPVVISHEHTWSYVGQAWRKFLDRELIGRFSDAFVAVSPEDRRRMIEIERVPRERTRLILNGVPEHQPEGGDVRAELAIPTEAPVIGAVGALRDQKAYAFLIEVAAELRGEFPDLRVLICGDGPEERKGALRAQARQLGIGDAVLVLGQRNDVANVLEAVDVAVLASDYEGLPLSVMEYMGAARPIVATRVGGVPELLDDGVHGLLVEPRDRAGMVAAIASLLRDPEHGRELGARAAERQAAKFTFPAMVHQVEALYEELFARTGRAGREGWTPSTSAR
jgi:glycosyltransferase involved in cell wall biosynthesis